MSVSKTVATVLNFMLLKTCDRNCLIIWVTEQNIIISLNHFIFWRTHYLRGNPFRIKAVKIWQSLSYYFAYDWTATAVRHHKKATTPSRKIFNREAQIKAYPKICLKCLPQIQQMKILRWKDDGGGLINRRVQTFTNESLIAARNGVRCCNTCVRNQTAGFE